MICFILFNLALLDCINYSNLPINDSPWGMFCLLGRVPNPDRSGRTFDKNVEHS